MKKVNIDLAQNNEPYPAPVASDSSEVRYPSFYVDSEKPLDIPSEGKMTVQFKRCSRNESEGPDGKVRYSISIDVQKILAIEGREVPPPTARYTDAVDALDAIKEQLEKEGKE